MTVTLRRTQKLADALPVTGGPPSESDTALGDWYLNRIVVDRRPLLLFVSERTLFPILLPAREVGSVPARLSEVVGARLRRAGIASALIDAEIAAMSPVRVAKTANRSVVGIMVDFGVAVPHRLGSIAWDDTTLPFVEAELAQTPCFSGRAFAATVWPDRATPEALAARWGAG